jgi:Domain of unknown function (DUF4357)
VSKPVSIPADRNELQKWILNAGCACADAILIYPPRTQRAGQEIMVLKGSMVQNFETDSCPRNVLQTRQRLLSLGKIKLDRICNPDGDMLLAEDIVFGSPSLAAGVVHGESKNGWHFWKLGNHHGQSLSQARVDENEGRLTLRYYEKPESVCVV